MKTGKEYTKVKSEPKRSRVFFSGRRRRDEDHFFFPPQAAGRYTNDKYEHEANAVSEKVATMDSKQVLQSNISTVPEASQGEASSLTRNANVSNGQPMDPATRSFMENRFGHDFSQVKIHTGSGAARAAQSVNAKAYTSGNGIVFNQGKYAPQTQAGRKLLAHELTHVIQQQRSAKNVIQRQALEEQEQEEPVETMAPESPKEMDEADTKQPSICCSSDERIVPQTGLNFNINEFITLDEMCTSRSCVSVTIRSRWASTHAARHFRVIMAVFGSGGSSSTITRRYDVGRETQRFDIGRCKNFMLTVEVISPTTSPNLIGTVDIRNC